jgi:uncharacterized protein (TIGR03084 family)
MVDVAEVLDDLRAESADADRLVADLAAVEWKRPTPAAGWTIAHQVAHLAWTDAAALLAIVDPDEFTARLAGAADEGFVDRGAEEYLDEPVRLLARWREGREQLLRALEGLPAGARTPWYGMPMSTASMATARIMETWAHGLDIADALAVGREPTARLRHIVHLGYRAMPYAYLMHGQGVPEEPVRLELSAPDGSQWTFGPEDAPNAVRGSALDFCLRVTQRAHRNDLDLVATGPVANEWLDIAQAFAGPSGAGRASTKDAS